MSKYKEKYGKKPKVVEAERFVFGATIPFSAGGSGPLKCKDWQWYLIDGNRKRHEVEGGDWIARESSGNFFPYPHDVFKIDFVPARRKRA